ncbi:hypothetical protein JH146_0656 [Methanocaldococcus bathoardescens]|uniref:Glycerophosphoryl diester phosphodiesterase membrane domain-containing protein n=1 Tax=Methanocaldococcus bathoardescens TaxID=1301915 RepID=A0A076LAX4_9EURY|nr:DUF4013 domain-containing protein [Methanocaldococcus bathoardescens]AIJ05505.1 hypothetical protein JH146_0656 [Methanocaldococcus bathoardescens]
MRKFEDYLTESFKYAFSDIKKGIIGGLLLAISGVFSVLLSIIMLTIGTNSNPNNIFKILTGMLIAIAVGFLISLVIGFVIDGYYVRIMKTTVEGFDNLPEWDNFIDLLMRGFLYFVGVLILAFIFLIIPIILFGIGVLLITQDEIIGMVSLMISFVIFIILLILLLFYLPLAEVNFSINGFLGFFEFKKIIKMMSLKYIVLVIVVGIIVLIIESIISAPFIFMDMLFSPHTHSYYANTISSTSFIIQLISATVSGFVGFFMAVFSKRAIALYYKDKIEEER